MGCWDETCMLTHLPIIVGEKTVAVFIAQKRNSLDTCYSDSIFAPISLPFFGQYDDYGRLENIAKDDVALKILHDNDFFQEKNGTFTPVEATTDNWEDQLIQLLNMARHGELYIRDSAMSSGYAPVWLSFMRQDFFDFGVNIVKNQISPSFLDDISYRVRLTNNLKVAVREGWLTGENMLPLTAITVFMNIQRIAWHPTSGSGSQNRLDHDYQVEFYEMMAKVANEITSDEF